MDEVPLKIRFLAKLPLVNIFLFYKPLVVIYELFMYYSNKCEEFYGLNEYKLMLQIRARLTEQIIMLHDELLKTMECMLRL